MASQLLAMLAACSQPSKDRMLPTPRPSTYTGLVEVDDPAEHSTAQAVAWAGDRAVVVGSAGRTHEVTPTAHPVLVDGARYHGWLRAVDRAGAVAWARRLDAGREIHVRAVAARGGALVVAGEQRAGDARAYTGWVASLAPDGAERWRLDGLGGAGATGLQAIAARDAGGVVAGGVRRGNGWLIAIDGQGRPSWDHDLAGLDEVTAVIAAGDAVVVAGVAGRTTTGAGTSRLLAVDATTGRTRWTTELPEHGRGELYALAAVADGGVAVGQAADAGGRDGAWIVRFAANGAVRSSQVIPTTRIASARAVAATGDGGFVVAGESLEDPRGRRAAVWRFDAAGIARWQHTYGDGEALVRGVAVTPDGGAVIVGAIQAGEAPQRAWVFEIDPQGAARWTVR
jgi:outer membrane protein assembly factor BamB